MTTEPDQPANQVQPDAPDAPAGADTKNSAAGTGASRAPAGTGASRAPAGTGASRAPAGTGASRAVTAAGRPPRGGRTLAALALILSLGGLGAAGYVYYEAVHRAPADALAERLAGVSAEVSRVDARLDALAESQQSALQALRERQDAARAATEEALRESLAAVARQAPPVSAEWQRAEIQYLLRIANHRLLMERDVPGALALLQSADTLLAELDDFALHPVRARVADEIAALQAVRGIDLQGLFLRLEVLKDEMDALPVRVPAYVAPEPEPEPADPTLWDSITRQVSAYLRVRRFDDAVMPLLAPDEAVYLELNLRLMMERAQLAAMRGEQLVFEESLAGAEDWIRTYLDPNARPVRHLLEELGKLRQVNLQQPLPDISGSLNALREVLRTPA